MMDREVMVLIEVPQSGPAIIRRHDQKWQQYLSRDMIAEIGAGRKALYMAYRNDNMWMFGKRMDVVMGGKVVR